MSYDPKTHRRLAPHEILRQGDEFRCSLGTFAPTAPLSFGMGVGVKMEYHRKIRPSPKPGYRWADAGEECKDHLIADGDVVQRLTCFQDRGRERNDAPYTRFLESGAVMPWPEDPRLTAEPAEIPPTEDLETYGYLDIVFTGARGGPDLRFADVDSPYGKSVRVGEWIVDYAANRQTLRLRPKDFIMKKPPENPFPIDSKSEQQSREEREREAWEHYSTDEPSPETGDVGWCWWAYGSMGCAPTYEAACRAAEAEIKRRIRNRMAVL